MYELVNFFLIGFSLVERWSDKLAVIKKMNYARWRQITPP
jgi:hypothetical protein